MTNITIITKIGTKPRPRFAKIGKFVRAYTPKTALTYERYIASEYQRLGGEYYESNKIAVHLEFFFKLPVNTPKWKSWAIDNFENYCDNHKDVDNLAKSVLDSLNGVAYDDDKQIITLNCSKHWTNKQERIQITIYKLVEANDTIKKEKYNDYKRSNRA